MVRKVAHLERCIVQQYLVYEVAEKYSDDHDIKYFNVTRSGLLGAYPRVKLEEVLNE